MSQISNITAHSVNCDPCEVGYYKPGTNAKDQTPKTGIKRGTDTNTFGPPRQGYRSVDTLPKTRGDYYIPGTNK